MTTEKQRSLLAHAWEVGGVTIHNNPLTMNQPDPQFLTRLSAELMTQAEEETKRGNELHEKGAGATASEAAAMTLARLALAIEKALR